jgi:IMP dehydrogenase
MSTSDGDLCYHYKNDLSGTPLINAPMDRVCSPELIHHLSETNWFTSIHRFFDSASSQFNFFIDCKVNKDKSLCFLSVGNIFKWKDWINELIVEYKYKASVKRQFGFLVDMANGDTNACVETVKYIREHCPFAIIMAGNVATRSGYRHLAEAGANFIRVGIGGGSICSTRLNTGFGVPTFESVMRCADVKIPGAYIVADGGIENTGDIMKVMAAGADMVMMGKMLASTDMAPGEKYDENLNVTTNEEEYKFIEYRGMASKGAQSVLSNKLRSVEGVSGAVKYTGKTEEVCAQIEANMRTAMTYYGGAKNWNEFSRSAKFIQLTSQGWIESGTRVENPQ